MEADYYSSKKHRILVIDNDVDLAHSLKEMIELEGAIVDVAYNGNEGILLHIQSPYDLIITDIVMPVMDGIEVVIWVKKFTPTTKIIVVSGNGYFNSKDYLKMAKELGANYILEKPFRFIDIQNLINSALCIGK